MRVAIYARVSSAGQRDANTIEGQLLVLRAHCAAHGWAVIAEYIDDGRSARTGQLEHRDGYARLVRDAQAGRFDIVLVFELDRLTRTEDMRERAQILGAFQALGISVATPSGGMLDLRTFTGELIATCKALVAAEESRIKTERTRAGKLRAIASGRKPAGPTPYGLTYDRKTGTWAVDPAGAAVVREIYQRVRAGESCAAIADDLHARGAPPPGRGAWSRHNVWRLVRSGHCVGTWRADKKRRLDVAVPAIVDAATWDAAQAALVVQGRRGLRRARHVYLLEGLARCGACGAPIAIRSATNRGRTPAAYVCRARKLARRGEARCSSPHVLVSDVDERVWSRVAEVLEDPELAADVQRRAAELQSDRKMWAADAAGYERRLAALARAEAGLLRRYSTGALGEDALDAELAAIARDRRSFTSQLEAAKRGAVGDAMEVESDAWLAELRALVAEATPETRQRVVRAVVAKATVDARRVKLTLLVGGRAGSLDTGAVALVGGSRCSSHHGAIRIRLIA